MSYQALARKWRPNEFASVVGQEHVVQALSNALDRDQVHHAFLFTGTRGVGKTTLARVFAKSLNCEQGVSSHPCNACPTCSAIDSASFVDLIEVDAASRTKVDDTRELLDNVQYAPTVGRYKVYLIDEVHMLSGHSFNALLKTLEEPPPHVKFLLATTDPQKLPVTVLSRCLQFNLKALYPEQIQQRLQDILLAEKIEVDSGAVQLLARAADGSLRDGLSLLDQAIAYGGGRVQESMVRQMLGTIEDQLVENIVRALIDDDAGALLGVAADMAERASDYVQALDEVLLQLYHLCLYQFSSTMLAAKQAEQPWHSELAPRISAEDLQLYYQIGLIGKRDLALAPDPRTGFEMVLLRMLAFKPAAENSARRPAENKAPGPAAAERQGANTPSSSGRSAELVSETATDAQIEPANAALPECVETAGETVGKPEPTIVQPSGPESENWCRMANQLPLNGLVKELAMNMGLRKQTREKYFFSLHPSHEHLLDTGRVQTITDALCESGFSVSIDIEVKPSDIETPAQLRRRRAEEKQKAAERAIVEDSNVRAIQDRFGATIIKESIRVRE